MIRTWGSEFRAPDHAIYVWSNGRKFDSTDQNQTGIYSPNLGINYLMIDTKYPDMTSNDHILQETFFRLIRSNG